MTFVTAGLGIAVVPEPVAELVVVGATYRPLARRDARIDLAVAVRAADENPALQRVLAVLRGLVCS